jgi:Flp pilus assembly protein TadD
LRSCRIHSLLALVAACATPDETLKLQVERASAAYRAHHDAEAEEWLRAAVAANGEPRLRLALAATLVRQRKDAEAAREIQLAGDGPRSVVLRLKGAIALHLGRLEQAEALYGELLAGDGRDAHARVGLAVARASRGDARAALELLDQAAVLAPKSALVFYNRALAWEQLGERGRALADAAAAAALDPDLPEAANNLAALLGKSGRRAEARATLAAAAARFPGYAPAHGNLGALLYLDGDAAGAARELEVAVARAPAQPAFHFDLGLAYFAAGDLARAKAAFLRVLELDPGNAGAARNLRFIEGRQQGTIIGDELPASAALQLEASFTA